MNQDTMTPAGVYLNHDMPEYLSNGRIWQGIPGIERTEKGRILVEHDDSEVRCFDPAIWIDTKGRLWLFWAQSHGMYDVVWASVADAPDAEKLFFGEPAAPREWIDAQQTHGYRSRRMAAPLCAVGSSFLRGVRRSSRAYAGDACQYLRLPRRG